MRATGNRLPSDENEKHWTDEITEVVDFDFSYKGLSLQTTALLAVAFLTLASFVGLARYGAPYYGYLVASATGVIFGFLVRRKRWQKRTESG